MYMKLDQIVNKGEKIVDETERYNYLYNEMEKLFGDQDFILSQVRCGSENDFSVYICAVSWVNEEGGPEQGIYRILINEVE